MNNVIEVKAIEWKHGWELHLGGRAVTQVGKLKNAVQQVHDYLDTVEPEVNHDDWDIVITQATA
ncbi:MAG: hypothetical protein Q4G30_09415 [Actinomycetaceae bacterium]|nr:hypothetical protein [Actinomycetaceae bacterium]